MGSRPGRYYHHSLMMYALRQRNDETQTIEDRHVWGLFSQEEWLAMLAEVGFEARSQRIELSQVSDIAVRCLLELDLNRKDKSMAHPLIDQFRFTRSEWLRGLEGVSEEDATRHFGPMNCIGWTVGHLAWHEQRYWLERAQGQILFPELNELYAYGAPMSTPALGEMLDIWHTVTQAADPFSTP